VSRRATRLGKKKRGKDCLICLVKWGVGSPVMWSLEGERNWGFGGKNTPSAEKKGKGGSPSYPCTTCLREFVKGQGEDNSKIERSRDVVYDLGGREGGGRRSLNLRKRKEYGSCLVRKRKSTYSGGGGEGGLRLVTLTETEKKKERSSPMS